VTRRKVDLARRRLANQQLLTPTLTEPAEVVRRLGAVQAQDYAGAKWGVGTRTRGAVDAMLERAVSAGAILRTHVLRPTWHFVAPADIRWMLTQTYWLEPATRSPRKRSPTAHLLPNYDEYFIGFKNRSAIGTRLSLATGELAGDALRAHIIVVDGQQVGGWKRTLTKAAVVVELRPRVGLTGPEQEAVVAATQAFGAFLDLPVELRGL